MTQLKWPDWRVPATYVASETHIHLFVFFFVCFFFFFFKKNSVLITKDQVSINNPITKYRETFTAYTRDWLPSVVQKKKK